MFSTPRNKCTSVLALLLCLFSPFILFSQNTVIADVVALDQPWMFNRLGTAQPTGMIFALKRDVVPIDATKGLVPGNVKLRDDKRPRPLVLRANEGDNLIVNFTNLLSPFKGRAPFDPYEPLPSTYTNPLTELSVNNTYPATRYAGLHIMGVEMKNNISSDGSWVAANANSLVPPINGRNTISYSVVCPKEGSYLLYSTGANVAEQNLNGAQIANGLFGCLAVQPVDSEWYRSQVSQADLYSAIVNYETEDGTSISKTNAEADGLNPPGFPIINYDTLDGSGDPVLKMYKEVDANTRELIYSDLTAVITGPKSNGYRWPESLDNPVFDSVWVQPERRLPFREFAIHYHEATLAVQAFPIFYEGPITKTMRGGPDNFAINYGTGGIGSEIYANRIKVGPMAECVDCAYEEFFLSAWSVGDPAMVVDVPANASGLSEEDVNLTLNNDLVYMATGAGDPTITPLKKSGSDDYVPFKASKVLYPDDPSNVYNSYMNDHLKFRLNHGGAGITHVHHQHQHQWLHSPNNDDGHYLDSQTLNPGTSYTLEMVHNGSGNLNKSVGDQIFHCHFYPHFAQGMWSMWRVHDVLELGTVLDNDGIAVPGARALPDAEIKTGTPIPGLVPLPSLAMAPIPGKISIVDGQVTVDDDTKNPGFPFFIPGIAGKRPPHPPMDFARGTRYDTRGRSLGTGDLNGGLPRGVIADGVVVFENHTEYDWTKIVDSLTYIELPRNGTRIEQLAMTAHATANHSTRTPEGNAATFELNGRPPVSGAPYADPYVNAKSVEAAGLAPEEPNVRVYKAADVQIDAVFNKSGWHYPQQRVISLWSDIATTVDGTRPPEPFFFRANSFDVVEFHQTNLVPDYYELDDFQPRTPTDIIGQHIHLVKFDVTSSDGAANGFNYEDGTFATKMVQERIASINKMGGVLSYRYVKGEPINNISNYRNGGRLTLLGPDPSWGDAPAGQDWNGAQTTIQRWYADPLFNNDMTDDRTLRTVFTHDHFGPSTHQQAGLYAGLLVEPQGTKWLDAVTGAQMGLNDDGGPTSWQALIVYDGADQDKSYREFALEFQDTQMGYLKDSKTKIAEYPHYFSGTRAYAGKTTANKDTIYQLAFGEYVDSTYTGWRDPGSALVNRGFPELVSTGGQGTMSLNYRNEPLPLRAPAKGLMSTGPDTDMAFSFSSTVRRSNSAYNQQPTLGAQINPAIPCTMTSLIPGTDTVSYCFRYPATALTPQMQPGDPYTPLLRAYMNDKVQVRTLVGAHINPHFFNIHGVKWLFEPSAINSGWRSTQAMSLSEHFEMNFSLPKTTGFPTPDGTNSATDYLYTASADALGMENGLWGIMRAYENKTNTLAALPNNDPNTPLKAMEPVGCPGDAPIRNYAVTAMWVGDRPNGHKDLTYNERYQNKDLDALVYVLDSEIQAFKTDPDYVIEPLVLRANAGDCINVQLSNKISPAFIQGQASAVYGTQKSSTVPFFVSTEVGLHAELLSYDVGTDDGFNVGVNGTQTIGIGDPSRTYTWYAGGYEYDKPTNKWSAVPIEFGTVPLLPADPIEQSFYGLFGALIIEPMGSVWREDENSMNAASVYSDTTMTNLLFREQVLQFQDGLNIVSTLSLKSPITKKPISPAPAINAINYRSEPLASRYFKVPNWVQGDFNSLHIADMLTNAKAGSAPETPTAVAVAGTPMRFRMSHAGGSGNGEVFTLHGHNWQEEPYTNGSSQLGNNPLSQTLGSRGQIGVWNSFDILIESAGGANNVPGDYLYRSFPNGDFQHGAWGIFKVSPVGQDIVIASKAEELPDGNYRLHGFTTINPSTGKMADKVTITASGQSVDIPVGDDGRWEFTNDKSISRKSLRKRITITSSNGGVLKMNLQQVQNLIDKNNREAPSISSSERLKLNKQNKAKRNLPEVGIKRGRILDK